MSKRRIVMIIVALLVGAAGLLGYQTYRTRQASAASSELQTERIGRGALMAFVGATGVVRANQTAVLTWGASGQIDTINVRVGDAVSAHQVLASLEQTSLAQNVILAQADLVSAQQALDDILNSRMPAVQARQALDEAEEALERLEDDLAAQQADAQMGLINAQEALDEAERVRNNLDYARASRASIDAAEADYLLAQAEVEKLEKAFNKVSGRKDDDPVRALALSQLSAARQNRDRALANLNWYKGTPDDQEIAEADANVAKARSDLVQARRLWEEVKDGPSTTETARLEAQLADAQRDWERVREGVDPDEVAAAEARVAAAQATLGLARIQAPFAATITQVQAQTGDQVSPGEIAVRLDDLSRLLVDVDVSEVDINQIGLGQTAVLSFDAVLGKEVQGEVVEVAPVGNEQQGTVNFTVTIELLDAGEDVRPGMTAAVNIAVSRLEDVLLVPNRAVRALEGQRVVYILGNGDQLEPVAVTLGATSDTHSEVRSGELQVGDAVVLNPPTTFNFGPDGGSPLGGGGRGQ